MLAQRVSSLTFTIPASLPTLPTLHITPKYPAPMSVLFPAELQPLVAQLEAHSYDNPQRAIEVARQLLVRCSLSEHLAYVYEKLGFAYLILGEHRLSCVFYEQARTIDPHNVYVLANFAHALYELGERDLALRHGREALRLKDLQACERLGQSVEALDVLHRGSRNLIAFSLYGDKPRYCEMAVLNVLAAQRHLPDFVCRVYLDSSVPLAVLQRLEAVGAQCVHLGEDATRMPPTFWRFLAMDDAQADYVMVRDVDALIDARDAHTVRQWYQSGAAFHIIRDDCCHTELILAGLFGIRAGAMRDIRSRIDAYVGAQGQASWSRFADQLFLRTHIWPHVRENALTHDRIYGYGQRLQAMSYHPHASQGPMSSFIGANHATCELACTLEPIPPDTQPYVTIQNGAGALVCRYGMRKEDDQTPSGRWIVLIPHLYKAPIESGHWRCEMVLAQSGRFQHGEGSVDPVLLGITSAPQPTKA